MTILVWFISSKQPKNLIAIEKSMMPGQNIYLSTKAYDRY